jgi:ferric-dicitrate binding protein FerR (iron transport regulator)
MIAATDIAGTERAQGADGCVGPRNLRADQHELENKRMKKSLIVLCAAAALVGCDQNQGGADSDRNQSTGFGSSRDSTTPGGSTGMSRDTNSSLNSGSSSASLTNANTNSAVGAPGSSSGQGSGSSSSGTQTPQN